jgi:hypothetical protein
MSLVCVPIQVLRKQLTLVDPEVSTLSTLTNVQNSLFIPSLGGMLNRRATYRLSGTPGEARTIARVRALLRPPTENADDENEKTDESEIGGAAFQPTLNRSSTITSTLNESRYAVLPHGESLAGWSQAEKDELDDLVRHKLHSRRAKFKRSLKGFGQYVRRRKLSLWLYCIF